MASFTLWSKPMAERKWATKFSFLPVCNFSCPESFRGPYPGRSIAMTRKPLRARKSRVPKSCQVCAEKAAPWRNNTRGSVLRPSSCVARWAPVEP
eukprot:scaffold1741_cov409-Prasinococcus_capsulatus_cf.AAC.7